MMRVLIALLALVGAARLTAQEPARVWVNTRSGIYHCAGSQAYGTTTSGEYLAEPEARRRGFRPRGGRVCTTPEPQGLLNSHDLSAARSLLPDSAPPSPGDSTVACVVRHIADGDTLECATEGRVRLIGIDTPEPGQEPFGSAATAALAAIIPTGATVQLEFDLERRDRYDRLLAYVWFRGQSVNWRLVRHGWAVSGRYPPNLRHAATFEAAESRARSELRGLWRVDGFRCRPDQYRRRSCAP